MITEIKFVLTNHMELHIATEARFFSEEFTDAFTELMDNYLSWSMTAEPFVYVESMHVFIDGNWVRL